MSHMNRRYFMQASLALTPTLFMGMRFANACGERWVEAIPAENLPNTLGMHFYSYITSRYSGDIMFDSSGSEYVSFITATGTTVYGAYAPAFDTPFKDKTQKIIDMHVATSDGNSDTSEIPVIINTGNLADDMHIKRIDIHVEKTISFIDAKKRHSVMKSFQLAGKQQFYPNAIPYISLRVQAEYCNSYRIIAVIVVEDKKGKTYNVVQTSENYSVFNCYKTVYIE